MSSVFLEKSRDVYNVWGVTRDDGGAVDRDLASNMMGGKRYIREGR